MTPLRADWLTYLKVGIVIGGGYFPVLKISLLQTALRVFVIPAWLSGNPVSRKYATGAAETRERHYGGRVRTYRRSIATHFQPGNFTFQIRVRESALRQSCPPLSNLLLTGVLLFLLHSRARFVYFYRPVSSTNYRYACNPFGTPGGAQQSAT